MINFHLSNLNSELLKIKIIGCLNAKWRPDLKDVVFFVSPLNFVMSSKWGLYDQRKDCV